ncbi:hypothetical protein [Enterobacter hormaechei]|uniref:hypothetical protein n=1 Tax=Enterobacter hormaechei TaxID=158836 RepID=UPI0032DA84C0
MAKSDSLTYSEFIFIYDELFKISDTWADLWMLLFLLHSECGRVINIRHSDIKGDYLHLPETKKFKSCNIFLDGKVKHIFKMRKKLNPGDIYVFQSKSNRVKFKVKPVTAIAMNMALKVAAKKITNKNISMKSSLNVNNG